MAQSTSSVAASGEECWTHGVSNHHIFLNYRVATEGKQAPGSLVFLAPLIFAQSSLFIILINKEPSLGIVQMIYDRLAVKKTKSGLPIFVFWDKKCLNYGENFEEGFLQGITTAQVIILLISNKV